MKTKFYLFLFLIFPLYTKADHILGGYMSYKNQGNGTYNFEIRLFRDCNSPGADFDNPIPVTIYRQNGANFFEIGTLSVPISMDVSSFYALEDDCMNLNFPFCIEEAKYLFEYQLPSIPFGDKIHVIYQRCCRVDLLSNINNSNEIGITISSEISYEADQLSNNSPNLNPLTFFKVCVGDEFVFNISATDDESNEIRYELCSPIIGGGLQGSAPNSGDANSCEGVTPLPACPPPFDQVEFVSPIYSPSSPLGSTSIFELNSETGEVSGVPNIVGQFLVGICIEEYSGDTLLSKTYQDLVFRADFFVDDKEPEGEKISIYPNPANDVVYIEVPNHPVEFELFVHDLNGVTVKKIMELKGPSIEVDLSEMQGIYFIELRSGEDFLLFEKILVF